MEELIRRLERVIQTGAPNKDGQHPISAETVLEVVKQLSEHGTNLAEVGTDTVYRKAVQYLLAYYVDKDKYVEAVDGLNHLPPANPQIQPKTTTMTVGRTKGEITMWYECDNCGEPVDQSDNYCRNCGRKFRKDG